MRTIQVLIDRETILSGAATAGEQAGTDRAFIALTAVQDSLSGQQP